MGTFVLSYINPCAPRRFDLVCLYRYLLHYHFTLYPLLHTNMPDWFGSEHSDAHNEVTNAGHKAALSHELIAAAASYEASTLLSFRS